MGHRYFSNTLSRTIWESKYRLHGEASITQTWQRVARVLAAVEKLPKVWEQQFYEVMEDFRFIPGGRILAGAGSPHKVTLFNCFVMGEIQDSLDGIFLALRESAMTLQQGGGVGLDFSSLRPKGQPARSVGSIASGPVSFMHIWDSMCATLLSTGARRGAMMATLRCDHPDIEAFIEAKQEPGKLRHFNLSVLVTDEFMQAVSEDIEWELVFPARASGEQEGGNKVIHTIRARALWNKIMRANYSYAEPGVLFIDRINQFNNLSYCEHISATNPCGEIPLPPYGACNLGAINLVKFINAEFTDHASIDMQAIIETVRVAVRLLDNVIDVSDFPLPQLKEMAECSRRVGLGITGLGDALIMLGLDYAEPEACDQAAMIMETICNTAYETSVELALEKGNFPAFNARAYTSTPFIRSLPEDIRFAIKQGGVRNSHLLAIAPTGTISLLANNVSSGLEPVFDASYTRKVRNEWGSVEEFEEDAYSLRRWRKLYPHPVSHLPPAFTTATGILPQQHLAMQAAVQPYVDNAISKTINISPQTSFVRFSNIYTQAYESGLKGCTTFRPNPVTGSVMEQHHFPETYSVCCGLDQEPD
ncbi:MAG: hypothetical protein BMS9Abin36_0483 [Gammaproteobacteria bacterium]|nr:MAG: hypothetical protein BMS9Abin36_0483 [Gammaproteobacteria bacterium]